MVEISVVIPVYNVEEFLKECLDSIVNQTFKDIEIICINDGSSDKSLDILNYYARNDDRFTVISQENGGHAVATNRGMELAKGKYLYLMDSDDRIELTTLEETYNYAEEKDVDFVLFQSLNYVTDEDRYYKTEIYSMDRVSEFVGDRVFDYKELGDLIFAIPVTPWSKLYRNDFIQRIGAKFPEGLVFDDNIFFWDVLFSAKRIAFYHKHLFIRRWYTYSSTTAGDKRFLDSIDINNLMIDRFKKYGEFENFKETLYNRKVNMGYNRFVGIKPEFKEMYFERLHDDFESIVNHGLYDDYMSVLDPRNAAIFNSCVDSKTAKEFQFEMAYWDSLNTRKRLENNIKDLKKEVGTYKNRANAISSENKILIQDLEYDFKKEINDLKDQNKTLRDQNRSLYNKNKYLMDEIARYNNSSSWKVTKPLRDFKKISSNKIELGNGNLTFSINKKNFNDDELIKFSKIKLVDSNGQEVEIDYNYLNVIYDDNFKIPFMNMKRNSEGYELPSYSLSRGVHKLCLKYGEVYSEEILVFVKDKDNLFDFNVWSGSDYSNDTSGFDKFQVENISSSDEWSSFGNKSIKVECNGLEKYQALVTPKQKINVGDFISGYVTVFNPEGDVIVRLYESSKSKFTDVTVPASRNPSQIRIDRTSISEEMQLLVISRVEQTFYADNFVFIRS